MSKAFRDCQVLVVDDEAGIREIIRDALEDVGAAVVEASGGDEAIKLLRSQKIDILISDIKMPKGDGIQLMSKVAEFGKNRPLCYLITGHGHQSQELTDLGVRKIFFKPFRVAEILEELESDLAS